MIPMTQLSATCQGNEIEATKVERGVQAGVESCAKCYLILFLLCWHGRSGPSPVGANDEISLRCQPSDI